MNRSAYFNWLLLCVWAAWLCAFSGYMMQFAWPGIWAPDLGVALFVALAARLPVHEIAKLAVCMGLARVAVTVDAPAGVLAAALVLGGALRIARSAVQVESPVIAAALAFLACASQSTWLEFVHLHGVHISGFEPPHPGVAWRAALTTAVVAGLLGGVLVNLPGVAGLTRRKSWAASASYR